MSKTENCACVSRASLENTRRSITPTITLQRGELFIFSYTALQAVSLKLWVTSPWAQQSGEVGPFDVVLPKAVTPNHVYFEVTGSRKLRFNPGSTTTLQLFPTVVPDGEVLQFELQGWSKDEIKLRNVSRSSVIPNGAITRSSEVNCFINQTNATRADSLAACSNCTEDNLSGCIPGGGGESGVLFIVIAGLAAVVGLFLLRRII